MGLLHGPKRRSHRKRIRVKDDLNPRSSNRPSRRWLRDAASWVPYVASWVPYVALAAITAALVIVLHFGVPEWPASPPQISDSMSSVQPF